MKIRLDILRHIPKDGKTFLQGFDYETENSAETVATALAALNRQTDIRDREGNPTTPIQWECNCLQKKCGACAMVINGRPRLACDARLSDYGKTIRLEPLKKFPVIADLVVDRQVLYDNLKTLQLWLREEANAGQQMAELAYDASRCLQCGCCLEVCPNFFSGGTFVGMAGGVPMTRLLSQLSAAQSKEAATLYSKHIYEGCGKSLACRNICPAKIDIDRMLVNANRMAVWKSFF